MNARESSRKHNLNMRKHSGNDDTSDCTRPFHHYVSSNNDGSFPMTDSVKEKLSWLRSQIIGDNSEFDTPFGKRRLTYADHTASGRSLHYIENYIIKNVLPSYGNSHTTDSYVGYKTTKMVNEATKYVKKCLGGGEDDALLFCGSGATAAIKRLQEVMGISVPSILRQKILNCLEKNERWVVFVGPYEHHSNILSWRQSLAEVVDIGLDEDGLLDMEALRDKLEFYRSSARRRPLLGSFSACSNVTGISSDTRGIARLLHQFGAFACFDFAASGPHTEIDMRSGEIDGYDAIFLSPHKFLGGPGTSGVLLVSKVLYRLKSSPPSTCGGGTVDFVNGFSEQDTLYVDDIEEREDAGTPAIIQKIRAALAFWVKEYITYKAIRRKEQSHIKQAFQSLLPNPYIWVLGNTTAKREAILSLLVFTTSTPSSAKIGKNNTVIDGKMKYKRDKPLHGPFVAKLLNDLFGIQARGGCACAGPYGHSLLNVDESQSLAFRSAIKKGYVGVKPGWTRISFPYYMSQEELDFILAALHFIAAFGQRFLPLYHFNWNTGVWTFSEKAIEETSLQWNSSTNYCPFCESPQASTIKELNKLEFYELEEQNSELETEEDENLMIGKYIQYLKTAKRLAQQLPKYPAPRSIPKEIDPNLVFFRV